LLVCGKAHLNPDRAAADLAVIDEALFCTFFFEHGNRKGLMAEGALNPGFGGGGPPLLNFDSVIRAVEAAGSATVAALQMVRLGEDHLPVGREVVVLEVFERG
jgi:hypothetical protein